MVTKWNQQVCRKATARKIIFLELPQVNQQPLASTKCSIKPKDFVHDRTKGYCKTWVQHMPIKRI